jgi:hypothetical protein
VATGKGSSYQPLGVRDRRRLNKAIRVLRSPFHSVRVAAHKEIQRILHKTRGIKRRLHERALKPAVRKVTPKRLHKTLGVHAEPAKAPKRQAPGPGTPWRGYTPLTDRPLTKSDLKERHKRKGRQTAQETPGQERQQDAERWRQAEKMTRTQQAERQNRLAEEQNRLLREQNRRAQPERAQDPKPQRDLLDDAGLRPQEARQERKRGTRRGPDKAASNGHAPEERTAPAPARTAHPLPHETIRQPTRSRTR